MAASKDALMWSREVDGCRTEAEAPGPAVVEETPAFGVEVAEDEAAQGPDADDRLAEPAPAEHRKDNGCEEC